MLRADWQHPLRRSPTIATVDTHEQLTPVEARILGALIEKAGTTPDSYPLSTNALVAACNQTTNREPVLDISEREVDQTMLELRERGLARTLTGAGHRVPKHRHVVEEAMRLDGEEVAVLAVLLLRGPQTLNEITTRTERYDGGPEGDRDRADAAIDRLAARVEPLVVRLERRPGEREPRIDQLWARSSGTSASASAVEPAGAAAAVAPAETGTTSADVAPRAVGTDRIAELERHVADLTARLTVLEAELGLTD